MESYSIWFYIWLLSCPCVHINSPVLFYCSVIFQGLGMGEIGYCLMGILLCILFCIFEYITVCSFTYLLISLYLEIYQNASGCLLSRDVHLCWSSTRARTESVWFTAVSPMPDIVPGIVGALNKKICKWVHGWTNKCINKACSLR